MITVWHCPVCDYARHKRWEEIGWLTNPRCDRCGTRMESALRSRLSRSSPRVADAARASRAAARIA
jgi:tRNA(Ile2) C34 agmatinyltransferase TiaS